MDCKRRGCQIEALDWKVCAQCFLTRYCSEKCLIEDWEESHEMSCPGHIFNLRDLVPPRESFLLKLGKGTYSEVYLAQHRKTQKYYALKIIKKSILSVTLPLEALFREISLHKSLNHDNIIKLYDQLEDKSRIYLVLEHSCKCNLYEYINSTKPIPEPIAAKIFVEICLGLNYMHGLGIMHRDVKPENILLNEENHAKICDMGWSAYYNKPRNTFCGTLDYMAPEILQGNGYSFPADIWGLGVLLYEMLHGKVPFGGSRDSDKMREIIESKLDFSDQISPGAKAMIKKILVYDPKRRPSITEILKQRWLQEQCTHDISIGSRIIHKELGEGSVVNSRGLVCTVDYSGNCIEYIIPEMIKTCRMPSEGFDEPGSEILKQAIGRSVSPIYRSTYGSKKMNLLDSYSTLSIIENSTMSAEATFREISMISDEESKVSDRQRELHQLQEMLEENKNKLVSRTTVRSNSLIDSVINKAGCVKR